MSSQWEISETHGADLLIVQVIERDSRSSARPCCGNAVTPSMRFLTAPRPAWEPEVHPHDRAANPPKHPHISLETQTMSVAGGDPSPRARRVFASIPHNLTINHNLNPGHNLTLTLNLTLVRPLPNEESLADQTVLPPRISPKTCQNLPKPAILPCKTATTVTTVPVIPCP
jgi:hypothetical protein